MPWINFVSVSGWDFVFGSVGNIIDTKFKFVVVLIPLSSIIIIWGTVYNKGKYPVGKRFLFSIPLLAIIAGGALTSGLISGKDEFNSKNSGEGLEIIGIGLWLTLISSIILCFEGITTFFSGSSIEKSEKSQIQPKEPSQPESIQPPKTNQSIILEQLEKLQNMKRDGLISEEEYQKMKNKIINSFD